MKTILEQRKAQIGNLQSIVIGLVVVGIVLGIGFMVMEKFYDQMTTGSEAADAVNKTIYAMKTVPTWLSIIIILAVVGILLSIVFSVMPRSQGTSV